MRARSLPLGSLSLALTLALSLSFSLLPRVSAEAGSVAATFTVNSTADLGDGLCTVAACTLREAIAAANETPALDTIRFAIPGAGPHTIQPTLPLPTVEFPVILDGTTQPGFAGHPIIELNGSMAGDEASGLEISAGDSTVRALVVNRFGASGIILRDEGNNVIEGNYIGTGLSGTTDLGNGTQGLLVTGGSSANRIGGLTPAARNIISGNERSGVYILGADATNNQLLGNFVGTDFTGVNDVGNGTQGIIISEARGTVIGGINPGARNVISGNGKHGIFINGASATANQIQGNFIGTDVTGTRAIRNRASGIYIVDAPAQVVGGLADGTGNVISGNFQDGIEILGAGATGIHIEGNRIGTNATGTAALSNLKNGISIKFAAQNTIGGTTRAARNLISANDEAGILLEGGSATENQVLGNFIGTDADGATALGNRTGIFIAGAVTTIIGSPAAGARNLISGNTEDGIAINGNDSQVRGNFIGTNLSGTAALPNGRSGISICIGFDNLIGGPATGARNLISGNGEDGVAIFSCGFTPGRNQIVGNFIGTDVTGFNALGNTRDGVSIDATGHDNTIGGEAVEQGNTIAFNERNGVFIAAPPESETTTSNAILSNRIFSNGALGIDLAPRGVNPNDSDNSSTGANRRQNFPEIRAVTSGGSQTIIEGTLTSLSNSAFRVQFFASATCDSSEYGEGQWLLATRTITTNSEGVAAFVATLPGTEQEGTIITATATDAADNTSEFSPCERVTVPSAITRGLFAVEAVRQRDTAFGLGLLLLLGAVAGFWHREHSAR